MDGSEWSEFRSPARDNDRRPPEAEAPDWPSDERRELVEATMEASQALLDEIWDNPEDAAYDAL